MAAYANPDVLVSTDWVKQNLGKPGIKIVEVDVDPKLYAAGHIPGATGWDWTSQLQDQVRRDIPTQAQFEKLCSDAGLANSDTVVLYGDASNWFAAYAFWLFKVYGHDKVKLMDGGRVKWLNDKSLPMTTDLPRPERSSYKAKPMDMTLRARVSEVLDIAEKKKPANLVDVRSPDEFTGKVIAPPGMTETAQRGGHIPGAKSIPWAGAVNTDTNTFKTADELRAIYADKNGVDPKKPTVAYCRIGERSSHTWFVLKYLLGYENVKNYDGSWTEYGSMVAVPIEK